MKLINWILGLFDKSKEEIDPRVAPWPFPVGAPKKKRKYTRKAKPVTKVPAKKTVVKKTAKKAR